MGVDQPECGAGRASPAKWPVVEYWQKRSQNVDRRAVGCNLVVLESAFPQSSCGYQTYFSASPCGQFEVRGFLAALPYLCSREGGPHTARPTPEAPRPLSHNVNPRDGPLRACVRAHAPFGLLLAGPLRERGAGRAAWWNRWPGHWHHVSSRGAARCLGPAKTKSRNRTSSPSKCRRLRSSIACGIPTR
jgi:hypothetical protein